jgi:hypothetical protein
MIGVIVATMALAEPALAHEGEEDIPAFTSVQEAIAILAAHPGGIPEATDKVHDALDARDQQGVNVSLVQSASAALERRGAGWRRGHLVDGSG